jgi:hypothetical protein
VKKKLLLAAQRIEVGALIRTSSLNGRAFRWAVAESETTNGAQVTRLEYAGERVRAFFQFDRYRHQHYALYAWGNGEGCEEHFVGSWPQQVRHLARWVAGLKHHRDNGGNPATH